MQKRPGTPEKTSPPAPHAPHSGCVNTRSARVVRRLRRARPSSSPGSAGGNAVSAMARTTCHRSDASASCKEAGDWPNDSARTASRSASLAQPGASPWRSIHARTGSTEAPTAPGTAAQSADTIASARSAAALTARTGMPPRPRLSAGKSTDVESVLFTTTTAGIPNSSTCSVRKSPLRTVADSSTTQTTSGRIACPGCSSTSRVTTSSGAFACKLYVPGKSTISHPSTPRIRADTADTVTPGMLPTLPLLPVSRLNRVVLPQFGLPTRATFTLRRSATCRGGGIPCLGEIWRTVFDAPHPKTGTRRRRSRLEAPLRGGVQGRV